MDCAYPVSVVRMESASSVPNWTEHATGDRGTLCGIPRERLSILRRTFDSTVPRRCAECAAALRPSFQDRSEANG